MAISVKDGAFVVTGAATLDLSSMVTVTASTGNPAYLVLNGLDRDEYTVAASDATGSVTGDGVSDQFSTIGSDNRGLGIVFAYQAASGRYYNTVYGYLDQLTYTASASANDVTSLSLFGTNVLSLATADASNAYALEQSDSAGYIGSVTIATQPSFQGTVPNAATPSSIAEIADSFIGKAWNMNGCWVLASTIAAEAGAALPVSSTMIGVRGQANGEWFVAYDGPAGQTGNWQSMVTEGDIIVIGSAESGHITTCVSGTGASAMLVDNITYENSRGQVTNLANDGSTSDVTIAAPHAASQEWAGVSSSLVVIYQLDTPVISNLLTADMIAEKGSQSLSQIFSAMDPAGRPVTEFQLYDSASTDFFSVSGATLSAHSAGTAITANSLSAVTLLCGSTACTDVIDIRAFNGDYWGDWQAMDVSVSAQSGATTSTSTTPTPTTPITSQSTAGITVTETTTQNWAAGQRVSFTLPAGTFTDTGGHIVSTTSYELNGPSVTGWLTYKEATETLSGAVPMTAFGVVTLEVIAVDSNGHSADDIFAVTLGLVSAIKFVGVAAEATGLPHMLSG